MAIVEAVFFGSVFGGGGLLLLFTAMRHLRRRREIAAWPRAEGQVVGHHVQSRRQHHRPVLEVQYRIGARTFTRVVESPTGLGYQRSVHARRDLEKHPIGGAVQLYVHPEKGEPAYHLLPEMTAIIALTTAGLLFVGVAVVAIAAAFWGDRPEP